MFHKNNMRAPQAASSSRSGAPNQAYGKLGEHYIYRDSPTPFWPQLITVRKLITVLYVILNLGEIGLGSRSVRNDDENTVTPNRSRP
jgi:hypothetical protein